MSWRKGYKRVPDFESELQPYPATRFFDQLSYIGDSNTGCFALETSEGLMLIDCLFPNQKSVDMIEKGIKDLGLDIHDLKCILITHGHGDHYGDAGYFKKKYGTKIYMSETDYEFGKVPSAIPFPPINFEVDGFLGDLDEFSLGDTKIKVVLTPGHTPGCLSFIIPVTDEGRKHYAGLWGGTGILPDTDKQAYINSCDHFTKVCDKYHVDCEIATHPFVDLGIERLELIRNIVDGVPNPFVIGEEGYRYYQKMFYDMCKSKM